MSKSWCIFWILKIGFFDRWWIENSLEFFSVLSPESSSKCTIFMTSCDRHFALMFFYGNQGIYDCRHECITMNPSWVVRLLTHFFASGKPQGHGGRRLESWLEIINVFVHNTYETISVRYDVQIILQSTESQRTRRDGTWFWNEICPCDQTQRFHIFSGSILGNALNHLTVRQSQTLYQEKACCSLHKKNTQPKNNKFYQTLLQQNEFVKSLVPLQNEWIWCSQTFHRFTSSAGAFISFLCAEGAIATSARCFRVALGVHMCDFLLLLFCTTYVDLRIYYILVSADCACFFVSCQLPDIGRPLPVCYTYL